MLLPLEGLAPGMSVLENLPDPSLDTFTDWPSILGI